MIKTLAIETSCDETSVAILEGERTVLTNLISSQIDTHRLYGGVVPEIASRLHLENVNIILKEALIDAGLSFCDIDVFAATRGPGLVGALLVGLSCAKTLAYSLEKPFIGVNHMEGHICSNYLTHKELEPPFISLVVSGGHTYLVDVKNYNSYTVVGQTKDDAAGEAFDKVARSLGLAYPGGPEIDRLAKKGDPSAIDFPRSLIDSGDFNFSFSGLKTSVLNYLNTQKMNKSPIIIEDIAASFQQAVLDVLIDKSFRLVREKGYRVLTVAGGVSANSSLQELIKARGEKEGIRTYFPEKILSTDNAAMIASAAYYQYKAGNLSPLTLSVDPNLGL